MLPFLAFTACSEYEFSNVSKQESQTGSVGDSYTNPIQDYPIEDLILQCLDYQDSLCPYNKEGEVLDQNCLEDLSDRFDKMNDLVERNFSEPNQDITVYLRYHQNIPTGEGQTDETDVFLIAGDKRVEVHKWHQENQFHTHSTMTSFPVDHLHCTAARVWLDRESIAHTMQTSFPGYDGPLENQETLYFHTYESPNQSWLNVGLEQYQNDDVYFLDSAKIEAKRATDQLLSTSADLTDVVPEESDYQMWSALYYVVE